MITVLSHQLLLPWAALCKLGRWKNKNSLRYFTKSTLCERWMVEANIPGWVDPQSKRKREAKVFSASRQRRHARPDNGYEGLNESADVADTRAADSSSFAKVSEKRWGEKRSSKREKDGWVRIKT